MWAIVLLGAVLLLVQADPAGPPQAQPGYLLLMQGHLQAWPSHLLLLETGHLLLQSGHLLLLESGHLLLLESGRLHR